MRDPMNFFTEEDFPGLCREFWFPEMLEIANSKIREHVGERVFETNYGWLEQKQTFAVHEAYLFCVREIK